MSTRNYSKKNLTIKPKEKEEAISNDIKVFIEEFLNSTKEDLKFRMSKLNNKDYVHSWFNLLKMTMVEEKKTDSKLSIGNVESMTWIIQPVAPKEETIISIDELKPSKKK